MTKRQLIEQVSTENAENRGQPRLTRADWLEKALELLVTNGVDSVRITRLADALGVTRGSFYWHFADRGELLNAMLEVWEQSNTASILRAATSAGTLEERILRLFMCWIDPDLFDPKLDFAIRDWARGDDALLQRIAQTDETRLEALIAMFVAHGLSPQMSIIRARNFYYVQMGYYALNVIEPLSIRLSYLATYFETYAGATLTPEAEAAFRSSVIMKKDLWGQEAIPLA